jgi:hypothetical protein
MNKNGVKLRTLSLSQGNSEGNFEKSPSEKNHSMFSNGLPEVLCRPEGKFRESRHNI